MESAKSQIPALLTAIAQAENRLAVLLGEAPGAVHAELSKPEPLPTPPPEVAIGVPADLLRQRPDVRKAERQLAVQQEREATTQRALVRARLIATVCSVLMVVAAISSMAAK